MDPEKEKVLTSLEMYQCGEGMSKRDKEDWDAGIHTHLLDSLVQDGFVVKVEGANLTGYELTAAGEDYVREWYREGEEMFPDEDGD